MEILLKHKKKRNRIPSGLSYLIAMPKQGQQSCKCVIWEGFFSDIVCHYYTVKWQCNYILERVKVLHTCIGKAVVDEWLKHWAVVQ